MKLIGYARVSTSEQGKSGLGLEAQRDAIRRFAKNGDHELIEIHTEVISGKFGLEQRPILRAAFQQAEKAGAVLIVSKLDRLSRQVEFVSNLMNRNKKFATVEDGLDCPTFNLHLKAALAEDERIRIGQRTRDGMRVAKARGIKIGGRTSGHEKAMENAAKAVKADADAFANNMRDQFEMMRKAGMTVGAMARHLNHQEIKTARGGQWYASSVCNVLRRIDSGSLVRLKKSEITKR